MNICLSNRILDELDMSYYEPTMTFSWKSGIDHYRLLSYLSFVFNNTTLIDIGTRSGASAIALARNPTNKIHSFDIEPCNGGPYRNVEYHVCDLLKTPEYWPLILGSPLISLDVGHDGSFEREFLDFLRKNSYTGLLYMDDIHAENFKEMETVWNEISEKKYDITSVGHFSGSGIVVFNSDIDIIMEGECSLFKNNWCENCANYLKTTIEQSLK